MLRGAGGRPGHDDSPPMGGDMARERKMFIQRLQPDAKRVSRAPPSTPGAAGEAGDVKGLSRGIQCRRWWSRCSGQIAQDRRDRRCLTARCPTYPIGRCAVMRRIRAAEEEIQSGNNPTWRKYALRHVTKSAEVPAPMNPELTPPGRFASRGPLALWRGAHPAAALRQVVA